jgi:PAS domain S-box-containing protein
VAARVSTGYATAMAVLAIAVFAAPGWNTVVWAAIGLLSVAAIAGGVRLNAPAHPRPWWLLGAAVAVMVAGDAIYGATVREPGDMPPVIADICYFAMFPLITAALIDLTRTGAILRDRSRLLDLLAFTCSATLAVWALVLGPTVHAPGLGGGDKSALAAYAIGDLLILLTAVRLLIAARWSWAVALLATGALSAFAVDIWYALSQLNSAWVPGQPAEVGYVVFYATWGAAALHPSMAQVTAPVEPHPRDLRGGWTVLLMLSLVIPPTVLLGEALAGGVRDAMLIAATSVVTFALVVTRLVDALRGHRAAVARERGLREACGALVSAATGAEVRDATRAGVERVLPAGAGHAMVLRFNDADESLPYPLPPEAAGRRTRIVSTAMLRPDLRESLEEFPGTIICPLIVDPRAARDPGAGALFVAAAEAALLVAQDALEVLAAQAALALERIALTDAANRRDHDAYLQAVVEHTTDVVLIIDDDQRLRYASPSVSTVLGVTPPVTATLAELVHSDDLAQVRRTLEQVDEAVHDIWSLRRPDGTRVLVEVTYRDLRRDRVVRGFVLTLRDVSEQQARRRAVLGRALESSPAGQNRRSVAKKFT